jgi:hypothetical protein
MHNWSCKELKDVIHNVILYKENEVFMYLTVKYLENSTTQESSGAFARRRFLRLG